MFKFKVLFKILKLTTTLILSWIACNIVAAQNQMEVYDEPEIILVDNYSELTKKMGYEDTTHSCSNPKKLTIVATTTHKEVAEVLQGFFEELALKRLFVYPVDIQEPIDYNNPDLWNRLRLLNQDSCIKLSEDPFFNAQSSHFKMSEFKDKLKSKIETGDVSMILAIGALPGIYLADSSLGIPVLVVDAINPVASGITERSNFSVKPNIHVQLETSEIQSLEEIYKILNFKKIGLFADFDKRADTILQINLFEELSAKYGFEIEICKGSFYGTKANVAHQYFIKCVTQLANKGVDAVFIGDYSGFDKASFYKDITPLITNNVMVIATSNYLVKVGALLSFFETDVENRGASEAIVVEKIVSGVAPEKIPQFYYYPVKFAINLQVARLIDWTPSFGALITAEYIYETIE